MVVNRQIKRQIRNFCIKHLYPAMYKEWEEYNFYSTIKEVFVDQQYKWLVDKLKSNTTIIDIGAYIGDTAIYFSQFDKVKRVLAYEPQLYAYNKAKKNTINNNKIILYNKAIGREKEDVIIKNGFSYAGSQIKTSKKGNTTDVIKLYNIINTIKTPIAIKSDCEGGEYNIFNKDLNLDKVYAIQMEYHEGAQNLLSILHQKGFKTHTKRFERKSSRKFPNLGFIYAYK